MFAVKIFKLLKYNVIFKNHIIILLVDNASTHVMRKYDRFKLSKSPGTNCPYKSIDWVDENGNNVSVKCFDEKGKSKGLFILCKELDLICEDAVMKDYSLARLRDLISTHKAFDERTILEIEAEKYGIKLLFLPKFHCELNPIESYWCFIKQYIRKRTDGTFNSCLSLLELAELTFSEHKEMHAKIWRRFWQAINMYAEPLPYEQVIKYLFGNRTAENKAHRKVYNTMLFADYQKQLKK